MKNELSIKIQFKYTEQENHKNSARHIYQTSWEYKNAPCIF